METSLQRAYDRFGLKPAAAGFSHFVPSDAAERPEVRPGRLSGCRSAIKSLTSARKLGQRVLIVDDDEVMLSLLKGFLGRAGYEVIAARGGREAVEKAQETALVAIVMDVMMPTVSGLDALRHLKSRRATEKVPVIVITANDHPFTKEEAHLAGAAAFLNKPFSPVQLLGALRSVTEAHAPTLPV